MSATQTPSDLRLFIPLTKIDVEKRLVYGIATAELPDLAGEVCDYASTKPLYEKWSEGVKKASGGRSLGNLRAMHGKVAAGKLTDITFNDEARQVEVCSKVVDDGEWKKCLEGVYTGFSQGGRYVKRWTDETTGLTHYTADPGEISLVDVPCLKEATFNIVKADGLVEKRAFQAVAEDPEADDIRAAAEVLAAGATDGRTWRDFIEPATTALMKAQTASALAKLDLGSAEPKEPAKAEAADDKTAKVDRQFDPEQLWSCGCADHKHITKAEAVRCMKKRHAEAEATAVAAPATAALEKLEAELGLAKPAEKTAEGPPDLEKAKAAGSNPSGAHSEAAEAHDSAAELHEGLASHDDMTADDTAGHLDAAASHRRAAASHKRAADKHGKKDADAGDASKKAALLTRHAADKSDGLFAEKCGEAVDLTKYSDAEARDSNGRWTSSGEQARHEAKSVTGALAASAFAMGVGEVSGRVGGKVGEKVGRLAGKAIAMAAAKGNPLAGEGGAAVGGKVGRVVGNIAGRMYGEARGWSFAAGKSVVVVGEGALKKDLHHIGRLADLIQSLYWMQESVQSEAAREGDGSPVPNALKAQISALSDTLVVMVQEETSELFSRDGGAYGPEVLAMAAGLPFGQRDAILKVSKDAPVHAMVADVLEKTQGEAINRTIDMFVTEMQALVKVGARNSAADIGRLQKAHDLLSELGAECAAAAGADEDSVDKMRDENTALRKTVEDLGLRMAAVSDQVVELGKRAAPAKAALRAVDKADDSAGADASAQTKTAAADLEKRIREMPPEERAKLLMKAALANPVSAIR